MHPIFFLMGICTQIDCVNLSAKLIQLFKPFRLAHYQKKENKEGELIHYLFNKTFQKKKNPYEPIVRCIEYVTAGLRYVQANEATTWIGVYCH